MAEFPNTAILSRNERKEKDTHPEFKGTADVQCPCCGKTSSFWLDAWVNLRKDGNGKFFKIKLKAKDAAPNFPDSPSGKPYQHPLAPKSNGPAEKPVSGGPGMPVDEIPFAPEWR